MRRNSINSRWAFPDLLGRGAGAEDHAGRDGGRAGGDQLGDLSTSTRQHRQTATGGSLGW